MKVAWIGIGAMGSRMAPHLASCAELSLFHPDVGRAKALADRIGAHVMTDLAEVADFDAVALMLPDSTVIDPLLRGEDGAPGLLGMITRGALVVDFSSSLPDSTIANAKAARSRDVGFVDAPVSGGVSGAEAATLSIMVGGSLEDYERAQSILSRLGTHIRHVGQVGAGHTLKALNQVLAASTFQATVEVLTAGRMLGLDPEVMVEVLQGSSGSSFQLLEVMPAAVLTETYQTGFALSLMDKDIRGAMSTIESIGAPSRVLHAVAQVYAQAQASAPPGADYTVVAQTNDEVTGIRSDTSRHPQPE